MNSYDVLIVGGGIIGGSIAIELAKQKLRVAILDRQQPGMEASWAAAGMLCGAPESPDAIPLVPLAKASLEIYGEYIAGVEAVSGRKTGYRRDGALMVFFAENAERELSTILAVHHGLGCAAEAIRVEEARRLEPALNPAVRAAAWLSDDGSVDPRALTEAVLLAAKKEGAEILTRPQGATSLATETNRCIGVMAGEEKISAGKVIVAAGCFSGKIPGIEKYAPTRPVRGQMIALAAPPSGMNLGRVVRSERGYLVPQANGRILAGTTSEHAGFEKRVTPAGMQQIFAAALEIAPELAQAGVVETWSGLRPDTPDHLPSLGPTDMDGLLIATGHYRNGILLAPITARLLRKWVTEQPLSVAVEAFSPMRFAEHEIGVRG
ncbi:MAG TPA: glycine oxidase ThiO [Candidatus Acidoferrales bacterium]|nr:glycine oxidase ThiO [Candidatus Acidoferrales bacterium]